MQSSFLALFAILTGFAVAVPTPFIKSRDECNVANCAVALGPLAVGCGGAIVAGGTNTVSDLGCLAGGLNAIANPPGPCVACAAALGKAKDAVGDAVTDSIESLGLQA